MTFAQGQNGFVAVGGNDSGVGGTLSLSVGQLVYTSSKGSNGSLTKGLQQPYEVYESTDSINKYPNIRLELKIYPNPTISNVILSIGDSASENLAYSLFDLNGRLLFLEKINSKKSTIPFENLPTATYFLRITNNDVILKTFKIIKNN